MPKIRPISDLRNYANVVCEVHENEPVYLTKNGKGAYAIVDIAEMNNYEKMKRELEFMKFILEGEESVRNEGLISFEDFKKNMGYNN